MTPNSKDDTRKTPGKRRRSILVPKTPLTPIKMFPARLFGCDASPYRGFVDPQTDNKENIPFNIDPNAETSAGTSERITVARSASEGIAANKIPRPLGPQAGFESRKPLRELSQVEINARSMQVSTVVSRPVFIAAPEGEQKADYEGLGEGSFRTVLSARSIARPRQPNTATRSPFLIYVD
ncbi:hypothetical protein BGX38DRAFT_1165713 [Terfezia claveryi]|nr:hypothetical protein BGX38DRAFT_1165713 [Terfezia claveryi]